MATMEHELCKPARTFTMVPCVVLNLLASTSKFCDAGYFTIFDEDEVNIYDASTTKITMSKSPIGKGCHNSVSTLSSVSCLSNKLHDPMVDR